MKLRNGEIRNVLQTDRSLRHANQFFSYDSKRETFAFRTRKCNASERTFAAEKYEAFSYKSPPAGRKSALRTPIFPSPGATESAPAGSPEALEDPLERRRDPPSRPERSSARKSAPNELFGRGLQTPGDLEAL